MLTQDEILTLAKQVASIRIAAKVMVDTEVNKLISQYDVPTQYAISAFANVYQQTAAVTSDAVTAGDVSVSIEVTKAKP